MPRYPQRAPQQRCVRRVAPAWVVRAHLPRRVGPWHAAPSHQPPPPGHTRTCYAHGRSCTLDAHGPEDEHLRQEVAQRHQERHQRGSCAPGGVLRAHPRGEAGRGTHHPSQAGAGQSDPGAADPGGLPAAAAAVRGCGQGAAVHAAAGLQHGGRGRGRRSLVGLPLTIDGRVGGVPRANEAHCARQQRPGREQASIQVVHCGGVRGDSCQLQARRPGPARARRSHQDRL
jgi:hypothetical protein